MSHAVCNITAACRGDWFPGDGTGGRESSMGYLTEAECVHRCNLEGANGVTMTNTTSRPRCYCEFGMTGSTGNSHYKTAFLDPCANASQVPADAFTPNFTLTLRGSDVPGEGNLVATNRHGKEGAVCASRFGLNEVDKRNLIKLEDTPPRPFPFLGPCRMPAAWLFPRPRLHQRLLLRPRDQLHVAQL